MSWPVWRFFGAPSLWGPHEEWNRDTVPPGEQRGPRPGEAGLREGRWAVYGG